MSGKKSDTGRLGRLRQQWWFPIVTGLLGILLGAIPAWYPLLRELLTAPYAASMKSHWVQPGRYRLVRCLSPQTFTTEDINMVLYLRITNTSSVTRQIDGYKVQINTQGNWLSLGRAPVFGSPKPLFIEFTPDGNKSTGYFDATSVALDRKLSTPVEPGQSAEGWVFLRHPAESPPRLQADTLLRVIVDDTRGDQVSISVSPPMKGQVWNQMELGVLPKGTAPACMAKSGP